MIRHRDVDAQGHGGEDRGHGSRVGGVEKGFVGRCAGGQDGGLEVEVADVEEGLDGGGLGVAGVDEVVAAGDPIVYSAQAESVASLGTSLGGGGDCEEDEGFEEWGLHGWVWCGSESDSCKSIPFCKRGTLQ